MQGLDLHGSAVTETQRSRMYQICQLLAHVQCKQKLNIITGYVHGLQKTKYLLLRLIYQQAAKDLRRLRILKTYSSDIHKADKCPKEMIRLHKTCMHVKGHNDRYSPEGSNIVTYPRRQVSSCGLKFTPDKTCTY